LPLWSNTAQVYKATLSFNNLIFRIIWHFWKIQQCFITFAFYYLIVIVEIILFRTFYIAWFQLLLIIIWSNALLFPFETPFSRLLLLDLFIGFDFIVLILHDVVDSFYLFVHDCWWRVLITRIRWRESNIFFRLVSRRCLITFNFTNFNLGFNLLLIIWKITFVALNTTTIIIFLWFWNAWSLRTFIWFWRFIFINDRMILALYVDKVKN